MVKEGLGLGPDDVGRSSKPVVFGGWRSRVDDEPDSPEQKEAATAVSIEGEVQVVKPRPLMFDDGVVFSPNAISSPNKRGRRFSTIESSSGGILRAPHRFQIVLTCLRIMITWHQ